MSDELGRAAGRGAFVTLSGQAIRISTQLVGLVVLSRLLSPADFGLVAMVTAIIGVADVLRDFGLSQAAVQTTTFTRSLRANLFWINSGVGALIAVAMVALAPIIAWIYHEPRLVAIAIALSATFFLNGLSTQYRASLNRDLRFVALAVIESVSAVAGLLVAVTAAILGSGYWALVYQAIAFSLIGLVLAASMGGWIPRLPRRNVGTMPLVKYGANLLGAQLLGYATRNVDTVAVGVAAGPVGVGYYSRAFELTMAPLNQVQSPATKVALPFLARLKDSSHDFNRFLLRGQAALLTPIAAVVVFVGAQSESFVDILLGSSWSGSAPLVTALSVGAALQAASYATYWFFLAKGLTNSNLRFALVSRPVIVAMILFGSLGGAIGVALAYSAGMLFNWILGLWWIYKVDSSAPSKRMLATGSRLISIWVGAGTISWLVVSSFGANSWLKISVGFLTYIAVVGVMALVWRSLRYDLLAPMSIIRSMRPKP